MGIVRGLIFSLVAGVVLIYLGFPVVPVGLIVVFLLARSGFEAAGGWPEAWYRLQGINYRQFYIILPNRRIGRYLKKDSDIKIGSAARATIQLSKEKSGDYGVPTEGDEMFDNQHGAPASLHNWDDYRPIPLFGREPDATRADGSLVPKAKIDPFLIHKAYENDVWERRHNANRKTSNLKWGIFGFLIVVAVVLSGIAIYESIYYGVNIACAVHAKGGACP